MRGPVPQLQAVTLSAAGLAKQSASWKNGMLGMLRFSVDADPMADADYPCLQVCMPRLDSEEAICEAWLGGGPITQGQHGAIGYRHDDAVVFGVIALPETHFAESAGGIGKTPLQQATESAYREVFALLEALNFPHLFRFWNYLPQINAHSFGLERYRQFNLGRQEAYSAQDDAAVSSVPAACALGTSQGPLSIAFLAGRIAPQRIENPRQVRAYHYPQQYGPRSPLFSRATLVKLREQELLFVSGTASVVGHATAHPGDVAAQARETLANVRSVLTEANRVAGHAQFGLHDLSCRVYVRRPADLPQIRAELAHCTEGTLNAVYLQADICREDLLLEIEGSAACAPGPVNGGGR